MKLTNKFNLPKPVVEALKFDDYNRGECDYTITELLKPPLQRALQKKFSDQVTEDVSDLNHRFEGKILHGYLERANRTGLAEKRFYITIANRVLSAQIDHLAWDDENEHVLTDYKRCPAFKLNKPSPDWEFQLNGQAYILKQNGLRIDGLQILGFGKDHSKVEAYFNPKYPQSPIMKVPIEYWDDERTYAAIVERIEMHERKPIPPCDDSDRYRSFDRRAGKVISRKCMFYCDVSSFCPQYKKEQANEIQNTAEFGGKLKLSKDKAE